MGQRATDQIKVSAPAERVMAVIIDLDTYPEWAEGISSVDVLTRDEQGRPLTARYEVDAKVFQLSYTLSYVHESPTRLTWSLLEGDQLSQLDGSYDLTDSDGQTVVDYALEVDLSLPLPGFMKKRGAKHILDTGLRGLKQRVEQG